MAHKQPSKWVLVSLVVCTAMAAMDSSIVSTSIPHIVSSLGGFSLFAWVFSIYVLAETVTIPIYGKLADQYGRKPILIVGAIIFILGSVCCALAWDITSLIMFRGLQGLGAGGVMATVNTLAGDIYTIEERADVEGWLSSIWGVSSIVGPTLGGALSEYASWHWIFLINLPIGALAVFLITKFIHEDVQVKKHKIDYLGSTLVLLTIATLVFGLLQGGDSWPWLSWQTAAVLVVVFMLAAMTKSVEARAEEPVLPGWLWSRRTVLGTNLAMVLMGIAMMGPITYLPTYAQTVHGLGPIAAGMVLGVMSIGWPLASSFSGKIYLKIGFRDAAMIGGVIFTLAGASFLLMTRETSVWLVVPVQFFIGCGAGILSTPALVGVQSVVGWRERGVVTGMHMFSRYLGNSLGAAVFGAVFNASLRKSLEQAPSGLGGAIAGDLNGVERMIRDPNTAPVYSEFLKNSFFHATWTVYSVIAVVAIMTVFALKMAPRKFPLVNDDGKPI